MAQFDAYVWVCGDHNADPFNGVRTLVPNGSGSVATNDMGTPADSSDDRWDITVRWDEHDPDSGTVGQQEVLLSVLP